MQCSTGSSRRSALESERALPGLHEKARAILGRELALAEAKSFSKYLITLMKWQGAQRLVGSVEPAWVVDHLFIDSLLFSRVVQLDGKRVADLGTGAGFPGVPLKIVFPTIDLTLIEARGKRVSFLRALLRELGLNDVKIVSDRAEAFSSGTDVEPAPGFDVVVMRCAGSLERSIPLAQRLARPGGRIVAAGSSKSIGTRDLEWTTVSIPGGGTRVFAAVTVS